jgi:hypothetical protein
VKPRTRRYNLTLKNQLLARLNGTWQDSPVRRETEVLEAKVGIEPAYTALQEARGQLGPTCPAASGCFILSPLFGELPPIGLI